MSHMVTFHFRCFLAVEWFGLMHIAACEGVDGYANGREHVKIELLKCKGCLIQWFIQIKYEYMHRGHRNACRTERTWDRSLFVPVAFTMPLGILCLFVFLRRCAGAEGQHSSNTQRSCLVSPTVHCSTLAKRMVLTKGSHYFQFSGLSTTIELLPDPGSCGKKATIQWHFYKCH